MEYNMQQFERDFMARTSAILDAYADDKDATLLLNCMVGLLIVPQQRLLRKLPNDKLNCLEDWGILPDAIESIGCDGEKEISDCTLHWLVRKLRNAVAHFNVLPLHSDGKVTGYELRDRSGFRAALSLDAIHRLCKRIAYCLDNPLVRTLKNEVEPEPWKKKANLFTNQVPQRVYIIDCPTGLARQCYELSSTTAEFYIAGCDDEIPLEGATDYTAGLEENEKRAWLFEKAALLVRTLPKRKRLSIYTNDPTLQSILCDELSEIAHRRLTHFGIYPILEKRPPKCPVALAA